MAKGLLTFPPAMEGRPRPDFVAKLPLVRAGTPFGSSLSRRGQSGPASEAAVEAQVGWQKVF
ncbi:MAG: hypothetical protein ISS50_03375 [Anaerolineae bacterium]|nr:hypothetical protein [Anaerolineae bacterium]